MCIVENNFDEIINEGGFQVIDGVCQYFLPVEEFFVFRQIDNFLPLEETIFPRQFRFDVIEGNFCIDEEFGFGLDEFENLFALDVDDEVDVGVEKDIMEVFMDE